MIDIIYFEIVWTVALVSWFKSTTGLLLNKTQDSNRVKFDPGSPSLFFCVTWLTNRRANRRGLVMSVSPLSIHVDLPTTPGPILSHRRRLLCHSKQSKTSSKPPSCWNFHSFYRGGGFLKYHTGILSRKQAQTHSLI